MVTTQGLIEAYFDCRKRKRKTASAIIYEMDYESKLIALRLEPLFEQIFSPRTFNCRKGKGQLYGVNILRQDIKNCSNGYTTDCYIMKLDLQGFFMSINKAMLARLIDRFVVESINSYLACLRQCDEYAMRRKILAKIDNHCFKWIYIKGHFEIIAIKKKYRTRYLTLQRIRDGTY